MVGESVVWRLTTSTGNPVGRVEGVIFPPYSAAILDADILEFIR